MLLASSQIFNKPFSRYSTQQRVRSTVTYYNLGINDHLKKLIPKEIFCGDFVISIT